jgi:hypothetical protein
VLRVVFSKFRPQDLTIRMLARKALAIGCFSLWLCACATRPPAPPADQSSEPLAEFKGFFRGDQINNDGARVNIEFDVQQNGNEITGTYRCTAGNANCRNQISRGWVKGTTSARGVRVSLQDSSWCLYNLNAFYLNSGEGQYSCYMGASLVDQGTFQINRITPQ